MGCIYYTVHGRPRTNVHRPLSSRQTKLRLIFWERPANRKAAPLCHTCTIVMSCNSASPGHLERLEGWKTGRHETSGNITLPLVIERLCMNPHQDLGRVVKLSARLSYYRLQHFVILQCLANCLTTPDSKALLSHCQAIKLISFTSSDACIIRPARPKWRL